MSVYEDFIVQQTATRDRALEAARDVLDGFLCECAHPDGYHEHGACQACRCVAFRPVAFEVKRASMLRKLAPGTRDPRD